MDVQLSGLLLVGWLWSLSSGSYYLPFVAFILFILLLAKARLSILPSLFLSLAATFSALLIYSCSMACINFVESMLSLHHTYTIQEQEWVPALVFSIAYTLFQLLFFLIVRRRFGIALSTVLSMTLISNFCALVLAYVISPI